VNCCLAAQLLLLQWDGTAAAALNQSKNLSAEPKRGHGHPALDEEAFQQLLSAAYVMQEHNARLRKAARAPADPTPPPEAAPSRPPRMDHQATATLVSDAESSCPNCGHMLQNGELYCGNCGLSRTFTPSTAGAQKTWSSLWEMYRTEDKPEAAPEAASEVHHADEIDLFPKELEEIVAEFSPDGGQHDEADGALAMSDEHATEEPVPAAEESTALVPSGAAAAASAWGSPWASAAKAREWLESLRGEDAEGSWLSGFWRTQRANVYLAVAAAVLLVVVLDWGTNFFSTAGAPSTGIYQRELSPFEKMLVSLGLAEPPPLRQVVHGNPDTKVWMDTKTALYYCPGSPLYGKTEGGKIAAQWEAQRDNFESAIRRPCN
jgi:hypothetical protein